MKTSRRAYLAALALPLPLPLAAGAAGFGAAAMASAIFTLVSFQLAFASGLALQSVKLRKVADWPAQVKPG